MPILDPNGNLVIGLHPIKEERRIHGPKDTKFLWSPLRRLERETFLALILDIDFYVLGVDVLSSGSAEETSFKPSDIFRSAISLDGSFILVFHNHPRERIVTPSKGDAKLTHALSSMCQIMKIHLLDHIIIGVRDYYSYAANGSILVRAKKYNAKAARALRTKSMKSTLHTGRLLVATDATVTLRTGD